MRINLNANKWLLKGYWAWSPYIGNNLERGIDQMGVTEWIPATVPGGVHYDLYRAGLIDHPYYNDNSIKCEWVENRWWIYKTTLSIGEADGLRYELVFEGLDYEADVYVDNRRIGSHKGMFHPLKLDITEFVNAHRELELKVVFRGAPDEMGFGKTSLTRTQKSRFNYKWDFSTRLVNIGFWGDVYVRVHKEMSLEDIALSTCTNGDRGEIQLEVEWASPCSGASDGRSAPVLHISCYSPDSRLVAEQQLDINRVSNRIVTKLEIENPELWYPNGYGDQPLYRLEIRIRAGETVLDELVHFAGIRHLEYALNAQSPEDALPYTVRINGENIYIKGVNITPFDHLYGNMTERHYEWMLFLIKRAHVNMIRVWGGGVIERKLFYELCDRYGIMVWQDFVQSSSGVENIPSKSEEFMDLLYRSAEAAVKSRRNHTSLTVWCGGNELTNERNKPADYTDRNLAMLKSIVERHDARRLFLPTTPSGPAENVVHEGSVAHDVHGQWKYQGNPDHYELYENADHLFHSEFGVDGMSSVKSLRKFLSEDYLTPVSMDQSLMWSHHGEWWDTFGRDRELFGDFGNISAMVDCSQWIQAEGLRFIIEADLRKKFKNSGSIIWQFNEPWPNVSCTSLCDYYGEPKMAYYWTKQAYRPISVSLSYGKLHYETGERFEAALHAHSIHAHDIEASVQVLSAEGRVLLQETYGCRADNRMSVSLGTLAFELTENYRGLFFVRLTVNGHEEGQTLYVFSTHKQEPYRPALQLSGSDLQIEDASDWIHTGDTGFPMVSKTFIVRNTGNQALLHVYPLEVTNRYWMEAEGGYITLFPGESHTVVVTCVEKQAGGFLAHDRGDTNEPFYHPQIHFRWFNYL